MIDECSTTKLYSKPLNLFFEVIMCVCKSEFVQVCVCVYVFAHAHVCMGTHGGARRDVRSLQAGVTVIRETPIGSQIWMLLLRYSHKCFEPWSISLITEVIFDWLSNVVNHTFLCSSQLCVGYCPRFSFEPKILFSCASCEYEGGNIHSEHKSCALSQTVAPPPIILRRLWNIWLNSYNIT